MKNELQAVKAWEETVTIPTYELGPEDQNPPLLIERRNIIHPGSWIEYPYPLQEDLYNRRTDKSWRAFFLENEYLRLMVLPELGGRLVSVWDKSASREALYRNHVLRYARIGIRGAFVSGGIEWNFPNGHTVTTSSPIDCAIRSNADGSATILFGDIERVSRMRWSVGVTLFRDYAFFETEIRLYNRTPLPNRYWFWANSAAPVSAGMEYVSTSSKVSDLQRILDFPIHDGVDISWDRNHPEPQDMFGLNHRADFGAWYNHDIGRGMVNAADRGESRGLKFFTWGNGDDGNIWQERLTESDGPYAEMQSGRFSTQRIWEIMPPFTEESWKEVWYPIASIGAPTYANREAAVSLAKTEKPGRFRLGAHANRVQKDALISLSATNGTRWERTVNLSPSAPLIEELSLKGVDPAKDDIAVTLRGSDGKMLACFTLRAKGEPELPIRSYVHIEPGRPRERAEDHWLVGVDREKLGEYDEARRCYERALEIDPEFSPANIRLGLIAFRQGMVETAIPRFRRVLDKDPADESARFFLGACELCSERFPEAAEDLKLLVRSRHRAASSYLLGGIYLGLGDIEKAVTQFQKCAAQYPWHEDAAAFLAYAFREQGRADEAAAIIGSILERDPLHLPALAESYFLARGSGDASAVTNAKNRLESVTRGEAQSYIELACGYALFGLYREAYDVLLLAAAKADPFVHYHLGHYAEKLGRSDASAHYTRGDAVDPRCVFPHRLESERVMRRMLQINPGNGRVLYYLGTLLCARDRVEEAIRCWEEAVKTEGGYSVLHRNLGRVYGKALKDPDRAIDEYGKALECDCGDYKLYLELERILARRGLEKERRALIESIPDELMSNDLIAERVAAFHAEAGDFDRALEILADTYFFPWEVYRGVRILYEDANIGKGLKLLQAGDHGKAVTCFREVMRYPRNIGVGESWRKANAEALYWIGVAQEKSGDAKSALESWTQAADEPRPAVSALSYFRAKALRKLGREKEALAAFDELLTFAEGNIRENRGDPVESRYLAGLARKGHGEEVKARSLFEEALALDHGHRRSRWELSGFTAEE